jgi:phosphatidylserine decarboxylase
MDDVHFIDRKSKKVCVEEIYGRWALSLMYGNSMGARLFAWLFLPLIARLAFLSRFYGFLQRRKGSRKKVKPFIQTFGVDVGEFEVSAGSFRSFDDFFIRKLKPECRPIDMRLDRAVLPADGRYLVCPDVSRAKGFYVKGQEFDVKTFLQDSVLSRRFCDGSMVIARLCPTDYHRFHFPIAGLPSKGRSIHGALYSVNPIALAKKLSIFSENKRVITEIDSPQFGTVLMVEVGATFVGSIHQTYVPERAVEKGDEKGYFSFGGSSIVLLFEKRRIVFDEDLLEGSLRHIEVRGFFGSSLGRVV